MRFYRRADGSLFRRINFIKAAFAAGMLIYVAQAAGIRESKPNPEQIQLGARLFRDQHFSSPKGDLLTSCSSCHLYSEDPEKLHAFTDSFARSWVPWRTSDPRRDGLRNTPTLFDVAEMTQLHFDGEFRSLEDLVKGTMSGRTYGWLPGEQTEAIQQIYQTVLNDTESDNASYRDQFNKAYGVDLEKLNKEEVIDLTARAVSDYLRTLKSKRTSPYDKFVQMNRLDSAPAQNETAAAFAKRLLARVTELEAKGQLKTTRDFGATAVSGMKIFYRTEGAQSAGNCVSCHQPPSFTDSSFHNMGVSQSEYDRLHGEGSFAALKIPSAAEAVRPSAKFRETPSRDKPGNVDLGFWNFVNMSNSPLRRATESDERFLQRMTATFKTPSLRNLTYSQPYMHNGAFHSLDSVLSELMRLSALAREGRVREADAGLAAITISEADTRPLIAFLNALNEVLQ
ncbi:MAG: cytochrome c peroxidase [Blastocatellia bacterium]